MQSIAALSVSLCNEHKRARATTIRYASLLIIRHDCCYCCWIPFLIHNTLLSILLPVSINLLLLPFYVALSFFVFPALMLVVWCFYLFSQSHFVWNHFHFSHFHVTALNCVCVYEHLSWSWSCCYCCRFSKDSVLLLLISSCLFSVACTFRVKMGFVHGIKMY